MTKVGIREKPALNADLDKGTEERGDDLDRERHSRGNLGSGAAVSDRVREEVEKKARRTFM